jgi:hypothetical protein
MLLPYGQRLPPDAILCPMADERWHDAQCRLCSGRGWIQRDAAVAAFQARRRANAATRRRQPAKRPKPHRTAVPQPPTSSELLPPTPTAAPAATLSSKEVATQLEVSYRQLHIWVTKGWIPGLAPNGSGVQLRWTPEQVHTAQQIKARLAVARAIQADPTTPVRGLDS